MLCSQGGAARWMPGAALLFACFSPDLQAHVGLDSPNGGNAFVAGSTVTIEWHAIVQHDTVDWDLWYSTASSSGPWNVISLDIPVGNPAEGVPHFYDWTVPEDFDTSAWVRVSQDNNIDIDYFDESDSSFAILAQGDFNASGQVGTADLAVWESGYGTSTGAAHNNGDANLDGRVNGTDFLFWQQQTESAAASFSVIRSVPEPATWCLFALSCVCATCRGRC